MLEVGIDVVDNYGYTPLHWACHYGQLCSVQVLLDCGANPNKQAPDMISPLLLAASGGHHEIVRLLLLKGADVNHMDIVSIFIVVLCTNINNYVDNKGWEYSLDVRCSW